MARPRRHLRRYLQLTLPALYLYAVHECVDKYLLSQRVVKPSLLITAATTALTPLFAHHFVVQQDLGLAGAAYAYVAVQVRGGAWRREPGVGGVGCSGTWGWPAPPTPT